MERIGETVALPPSERAMREQSENDLSDALLIATVLAMALIGQLLRRFTMQGDLARYDAKIQAKRKADAEALAATHANDLKVLRDQIDADGMNDDDRAVLARMKQEAGE